MNRNAKINAFVKTLADNQVTLALCESMTCGLAAHMLSTCKGTSTMFKGSIVCYNEEVKRSLLGIPDRVIKKYTAESRKVTEQITRKLSRLISADIHAGLTGLASDGGSETGKKPVGTVFFSILYKRKIHNSSHVFRGTPLQIREKACLRLYELILQTYRHNRKTK
jgi:PncC family amidohydrolase